MRLVINAIKCCLAFILSFSSAELASNATSRHADHAHVRTDHVFEMRDDGSVLHSFNGSRDVVTQDDGISALNDRLRLMRTGQRRAQERHVGLFEAMQRQAMEQQAERARRANEMISRAQHAPPTFVASTLLPVLLLLRLASYCLQCYDTQLYDRSMAAAQDAVAASAFGRAAVVAQHAVRRTGWSLHDITRVCVCCFFVHEGLAVFQIKLAQMEHASVPIWTPFGQMRVLPPWEKSDAMDMVLLFTALGTMLNLLPELGLCLLLVDVATDTLDLLARVTLMSMAGQEMRVDELTAKKLSLLGVMALVATHHYREERAALAHRAAPKTGSNGGDARAAAVVVPPLLLLVGRLLMATIFFYAAGSELGRMLMPESLSDIDPDDPHNIMWPKVVEITLAVPFVLGLRTIATARALTATLAMEAITCWQFWRIESLQTRLHAREHFTVNVAVAGGLLLISQVGGGKLSVDSLLKRD